MSDPIPTEEGRRRYPPDGMYEGLPCLCVPQCPSPCDGMDSTCCNSAGTCPACFAMYYDIRDAQDLAELDGEQSA